MFLVNGTLKPLVVQYNKIRASTASVKKNKNGSYTFLNCGYKRTIKLKVDQAEALIKILGINELKEDLI